MPDDEASEVGKLRQAIAALEAQQRESGLNLSAQIAELQPHLQEARGAWQRGSGAVSTMDLKARGLERYSRQRGRQPHRQSPPGLEA
jgi:hypothetical protein